MKHKPVYETTIEAGKSMIVYRKIEADDNFLFRKAMAITINAPALEKCDKIKLKLLHRNVEIEATKIEIKLHKDVHTYQGEIKYRYPITKWKVTSGDTDWCKKVLSEYTK